MSGHIPPEEICTLLSAEEAKSVSEEAPAYLERCAVAKTINLAANTGCKSCTYNSYISEEFRKELEELGYGVRYTPRNHAADCLPIIIDWK